jgi:hypothetical protein
LAAQSRQHECKERYKNQQRHDKEQSSKKKT